MLKLPKGIPFPQEILPLAFRNLRVSYSPTISPKVDNLVSESGMRQSVLRDDSNPLNYFRVFLNFGYFLRYIPFKLTRIHDTNIYVIKSSLCHKTACILIHGLSAFRFFTSIRDILNSHNDASPVLYFEICRSILTAVYMSVFKWTFWHKDKLFCRIFNDLANLNFTSVKYRPFCQCHKERRTLKVRTVATWICILYSVTPFFSVVLGSGVIDVRQWELNQLQESYGGMARYTFFLQPTTTPYPSAQQDLYTYILIGVYVLMNFYYFLGGHFFDLSVLMGALTLRHLASEFAKSVDNLDPFYIQKILTEFAVLKEFSKKINGAIGCVAFCFVIEALPYYATHLDDILTLEDWYDRFRYIFYFGNFFSILIISSDIIVKIDSLKTWLSKGENCLSLPPTKAIVLINELSSYPVGLRPGGIVTITYGFIGTMVSVVVTYAVIILQFNFAKSQSCP